jgi:hypothetical protein
MRRITADTTFSRPLRYYDTWVANGNAIGLGQANHLADAKLVRADLARLTAEISG